MLWNLLLIVNHYLWFIFSVERISEMNFIFGCNFSFWIQLQWLVLCRVAYLYDEGRMSLIWYFSKIVIFSSRLFENFLPEGMILYFPRMLWHFLVLSRCPNSWHLKHYKLVMISIFQISNISKKISSHLEIFKLAMIAIIISVTHCKISS